MESAGLPEAACMILTAPERMVRPALQRSRDRDPVHGQFVIHVTADTGAGAIGGWGQTAKHCWSKSREFKAALIWQPGGGWVRERELRQGLRRDLAG